MNKVNRLKRNEGGFPELLRQVDPAPKQVYWRGMPPAQWVALPKVSIVGSRLASSYGRQVCLKLARELAQDGVVVISGLALGIDAVAHQGALEGGGLTVAVLPSDATKVYPATNRALAQSILESGGSLISEYHDNAQPKRYDFIARNRLISGLADVVVVAEASIKSGSLHTARFALEQGRTVMAVPGDITRSTSEGCNHLLKSGALVVTEPKDVLLALGQDTTEAASHSKNRQQWPPHLQLIIDLMGQGVMDISELQLGSGLSASQFFAALTELELKALIRPLGGGQWGLR